MLIAIASGVIVAAVTAFIMSRARKYRRLFSDDHFAEIVRRAPALKQAALGHVMATDADAPSSPADPRVMTTSAGLAIVYTVRARMTDHVHHVSVSAAGGYTAHAVGATFTAAIVELVALPADKTRFGVTRSTVHHAEVVLDEAEHARVCDAPMRETDVAELRRACLDARRTQTWFAVAS